MNIVDWFVIIIYAAVIIGIAYVFKRTQKNIDEYYLAGRKTRWWQSGLSTMATQLGAISLVSAPAFVAIKEGGGLKWLCYEFGAPLGILLVMVVIIPVLHRNKCISIYEYLENRFDSGTRNLVSFLFLMGRGLATAVSVLAGGIILSTALGIPVFSAIILIGVITVIYDMLGGIRVVIFSDVLQMGIIMVGLLVCGGMALRLIDWNTAWSVIAAERLTILDFKHWGVSSVGEYSFWPMTIGGFFLYASYYGCDQSQVQRELTVGSIDGVRKSLLVNAFGRFPLVLLYCTLGILVGALFTYPHTLERIASAMQSDTASITRILQKDPDRMLPLFILTVLPHGVIGFIFVAIMSALMSSLDSSLNSLSAVTVRDFYQRYLKPGASEQHYLKVSRICTLLWGVFCISAALIFAGFGGATRQTTIVLINAVGSLLYGPILAAFLLGMVSKRASAQAVKIGVCSGFFINLILWRTTSISWLWWNVCGFIVPWIVSFIFSKTKLPGKRETVSNALLCTREGVKEKKWTSLYGLVAFYFFIIILICYFIQKGV